MRVVEIQEVESFLRRVQLEIPAQDVDEAVKKTFGEIAKTVRVKGFRKGKVSWKVVEQMPQYRMYGYDEVKKQLREEGLQKFFAEDNELDIVAVSRFEDLKVKKGNPLNLTFELEVRPQPDLSVVPSLEIAFEKVELQDSDLDVLLDAEREKLATLQPVDGRGVQEGDHLQVHLKITEDGELKRDQDGVDVAPDSDELPAQVREALLGKQLDEEVSVDVVEEEEVTHNYTVKVLNIQEKVAPELSDEMAKEAGHDDLESMKSSFRSRLEKGEERISRDRAFEQLLEQLFEKVELPVPPQWLENHLDFKLRSFLQQLRLPAEQAEQFKHAMRGGMLPEAQKEIRTNIVLEAVIKAQDLKTSDEDFDARLQEMADEQSRSLAYIRSSLQKQGLDNVRREMTTEKALQWLLDQANVKEEVFTKQARQEKIEVEVEARRAEQEKAHAEAEAHDHTHECEDENCTHEHH